MPNPTLSRSVRRWSSQPITWLILTNKTQYRKIHKLNTIQKEINAKYSKTKLPRFSRHLGHLASKRDGLILQCFRAHTGQNCWQLKLYHWLLYNLKHEQPTWLVVSALTKQCHGIHNCITNLHTSRTTHSTNMTNAMSTWKKNQPLNNDINRLTQHSNTATHGTEINRNQSTTTTSYCEQLLTHRVNSSYTTRHKICVTKKLGASHTDFNTTRLYGVKQHTPQCSW